MRRLFISPPFGNYVSVPGSPYISRIHGSYTPEPRSGLILKIIKTLRYKNGWINQIGLRNPGIDNIPYHTLNKCHRENGNIISLAIRNEDDIKKLTERIDKDLNIELNISCPNVTKNLPISVINDLSLFLHPKRSYCSVKLPPLVNKDIICHLYSNGFRQFHCTNTLSTPDGGMSGAILKPYVKDLATFIRNECPESTIICGGGIKNIHDVIEYADHGADHFSVSTLLFNPIAFYKLIQDFKSF
jgi:dihydroorotate dehydrogenase